MHPLGSPPARLLRLLSARLADLGSSALLGRGRPTGHPATASGARASRLQRHRFHRLFGTIQVCVLVLCSVTRLGAELAAAVRLLKV